MATCPNCARNLKLSDWRDTCPDCGASILYFGMDARLEEEADRTELAAAAAQKKYDRVRAALIGNKLAMARLAAAVIGVLGIAGPVAAVVTKFLPFRTVLYIGIPLVAAALAALLILQRIIRKQGGVPVAYKPCFIAGIPEEEVLAFLAEGGTVKELREQKAREDIIACDPA